MKLKITFVFASVCVIVILAFGIKIRNAQAAERETISFGSVQLYLGEPKDEALAALVSVGDIVTPVAGAEVLRNSFAVGWKTGREYHYIGNVYFNPNLTSAIKNWTPEESSNFDLARAIFYASKSLNDQGCKSVLMDVGSNDQRGALMRTVFLYCVGSNRRFEISASDFAAETSAPGKSAMLSEFLQSPK